MPGQDPAYKLFREDATRFLVLLTAKLGYPVAMKIPELLIPAGSMSKLRVALAYGADAVYVGAAGFSMRPDEASFDVDQLAAATQLAHQHGKPIYVGVNSLLFPDDLETLRTWLDATKSISFDAIIVADPGALTLVQQQRPDIEVHISTQLSTANSMAAEFWARAGAARVVLARECTIDDAKQISRESGVGVETVVHGAMELANSDVFALAAFVAGRNASQGNCKHSCRWEWGLVETQRPDEVTSIIETEKETVFLGSKDLCLLEHLPLLMGGEITSLKVEGRMKGEYYVAVVTRVYRAAIDAYLADPDGFELDPAWMQELETITHQPYCTGFAFGYPTEAPESLQSTGRLAGTYDVVGVVEKTTADGTLQVMVKKPFAAGEVVEWIGPQMAGGSLTFGEIKSIAGGAVQRTHPGNVVTVQICDTGGASEKIPDMAILRIKIGQ